MNSNEREKSLVPNVDIGKNGASNVVSNASRRYEAKLTTFPNYSMSSSTSLVHHHKQTSKLLPVSNCNPTMRADHTRGMAVRSTLPAVPSENTRRSNLSAVPLENKRSQNLNVFSVVVEDAVRRVVQENLEDLHQDVRLIQRTLSRLALKMSNPKLIAVIGAGPCGLAAAKCCLEENLDVVIFDKTDNVGGLWCYRDYDKEGIPSVMKSTVINTSKEMSAFSDFPPPANFPNFMHNSLMFQYFKQYAEKFGVLQHVKLLTEAVKVTQTEDYERTGRWYVFTKNLKTGETAKDVFDGVLLATGHHSYPYIPEFRGLTSFKGLLLHTHSLKKAAGFEDKVVLVVGIGNSAVDAAVELSTVAKKVYLSTRRGAWLFHRVGPDGKPFDAIYTRRILDYANKIVPFRVSCWYVERELNKRFDHATYGLKPKHRVWNQHPTINDALPNKILSGTVILREDIDRFTETGVIFKSDDAVTELDAVILATGYEIKFPLLSEDIIPVKDNKVQLYKYMFPPHLPHASLAVIALTQVIGAVFPVAEAQGRWYSLIMNGKRKLPRKEVMLSDIKKKETETARRYIPSLRHTIQVDYIPYLDELAEQIGAQPKLYKLFFTDPKVFWRLMIGPSLPYQYRLRGPHKWSGARVAILGYNDRVLAALNTRKA